MAESPGTARSALVIGCGKQDGVGYAVARSLLGGGMHVTITDVAPATPGPGYPVGTRDELDAAAAELSKFGEVDTQTCDVTHEASVRSAFDEVVRRRGRIEAVVNCAGVAVGIKPLAKLSLEEWQTNLAVMATGAFLVSRAAAQHMLEVGVQGRIVSIGSVLSKTGRANASAYAAAKFALVGMTQALAEEVGPRGITANVVCPGFIETSMLGVPGGIYDTVSKFGDSDIEEFRQSVIADVPMGRFTTVEDVAACVSYLVSPGARFITGQAINVSGGSEFH